MQLQPCRPGFSRRCVSQETGPHSPRNFLPSVAAAMNVPKTDRDRLGGWKAEESERDARVSKYRIMSIQQQVARTFTNTEASDSLSELKAMEDCATFLKQEGVSEVNCSRYLSRPINRTLVKQKREEESLETMPKEHQEVQVVQDEVGVAVPAASTRIQAWSAGRSAALVENPKEARQQWR